MSQPEVLVAGGGPYAEDAALAENEVLERLPQYFDVVLSGATEYELVQHAPYRMHQRSAPTYRVRRVLLAGDAAHITNPVGGLVSRSDCSTPSR